MIIKCKQFKKIITVGWDGDLVSEFKIKKNKILGYTSDFEKKFRFKTNL